MWKQHERRTFACGMSLRNAPALTIVVILIVVFVSATGHAAPPVLPSETTAAPSATSTPALSESDFAAAHTNLTQEFRANPNPATLYQLGALAAKQGQWVEAQDLLRRYLADPTVDQNTPAAQEAQRIVDRPPEASGELGLIADPGALVFVDDRIVGVLPLAQPLLLRSGPHRIRMELGKRTMSRKLSIQTGRGVEMRCNIAADTELRTVLPAVIVLTDYQRLPAELPRQLAAVIRRAIQGAHMTLFKAELALAQAPAQASCLDQRDCQVLLAAKNQADYVLNIQVQANALPAPCAWKIKTALVDAEVADVAAAAEPPCADAGAPAVTAALSATLEKVLEQGSARLRGSVDINSNPVGALIQLGDRKLGKTPYRHALWTGSYELMISQPGYQEQRVPLVVEDGKTTTITVDLEPAPLSATGSPSVGAPGGSSRPRWRLYTGAAALGIGVVLTGFGAAGLVIHDQCFPTLMAPAEACRQRYDTLVPGAALISVGAALAITGVVLLALPNKRH